MVNSIKKESKKPKGVFNKKIHYLTNLSWDVKIMNTINIYIVGEKGLRVSDTCCLISRGAQL